MRGWSCQWQDARVATGRERAYHHGDLRRALLDALAEAVLEVGPAAVSLRDVARRAGVSHAAPAHHFGDKAGLLTAFAAEGHELLAAELAAAWRASGDFLEVGVAYVRFAVAHRAHFEVMFRPELLRRDDPVLREAGARSFAALAAGGEELPPGADGEGAAIGAWAFVHGLATLWLGGNLPPQLDDPEALTRRVAHALEARPAP